MAGRRVCHTAVSVQLCLPLPTIPRLALWSLQPWRRALHAPAVSRATADNRRHCQAHPSACGALHRWWRGSSRPASTCTTRRTERPWTPCCTCCRLLGGRCTRRRGWRCSSTSSSSSTSRRRRPWEPLEGGGTGGHTGERFSHEPPGRAMIVPQITTSQKCTLIHTCACSPFSNCEPGPCTSAPRLLDWRSGGPGRADAPIAPIAGEPAAAVDVHTAAAALPGLFAYGRLHTLKSLGSCCKHTALPRFRPHTRSAAASCGPVRTFSCRPHARPHTPALSSSAVHHTVAAAAASCRKRTITSL